MNNLDDLIQDLQDMIATPSVNPFEGPMPSPAPEHAMTTLFAKQLAALGLEVSYQPVADGRTNLWGRLAGTGGGPTVMLAGHLDTVDVEGYDNCFTPTVENGRIYGRGSCDMKAGLASYLEVVRRLQASKVTLAGDLIIAGLVDEEYAMIGSELFGREGPKVDHAIVAEPSSLQLCPAHKGQVCLTLSLKGLSVHSSLPHKGINAIFHMGRVLAALEQYAADLGNRPKHALCGSPTLNVGIIKGGANVSSVPDFCHLDIDRRTIPGEGYDSVMRELTAVVESVKATTPQLEYSFSQPSLNVPPLATSAESAVVKAMQAAIEQTLGSAGTLHSFTGSTDAPNLRCDAVICGAGALAQAHSLNEYIELAEIDQAVEIYIAAIKTLSAQPAA